MPKQRSRLKIRINEGLVVVEGFYARVIDRVIKEVQLRIIKEAKIRTGYP